LNVTGGSDALVDTGGSVEMPVESAVTPDEMPVEVMGASTDDVPVLTAVSPACTGVSTVDIPGATPGETPVETIGISPGVTPGEAIGATSGETIGVSTGVTPGVTTGVSTGVTPGVSPVETSGVSPGVTIGVSTGVTGTSVGVERAIISGLSVVAVGVCSKGRVTPGTTGGSPVEMSGGIGLGVTAGIGAGTDGLTVAVEGTPTC